MGKKFDEKEIEKRTLLRDIINLFSLTGLIYGPLDERLNIREAIEKQLKKPVPHYRTFLENNFLACLGGITFTLFLIQAVTGILLLMYYRPTIDEAYKSIVEVSNIVPYGWLIRGMHHWAANLMIVTLFLHMFKVFISGAYKPPRDFNWVTGITLMAITLGFGFSGYLLPWNQISYWATTVGTEAFSAVPFVGEHIKFLVRGGQDIGQITLTRFFALHVVILPAIALVLLFLHFAMIRRQGISEPL